MVGFPTSHSTPTRVVIVGGGFGGVYAALRLQSLLRRRRDVDVTLVNRDNYFLFTPMLPQAATSSIDTRHMVSTIRRICPRIRFFAAEVEDIDLDGKTVVLTHAHGHRHVLEYDHLLIALGGVTNFFGLPGLAENALTVKTLGDAIRLRNHALDMLEQAELEDDIDLRRRLLTFVIAGAGFAGIETAAELDIFLRHAAVMYRNVRPADIKTIVLDAQERVLPELSESLGNFTKRTLEARGVEFRLGTRVRSADATGVDLADGSRIETSTFVWAGGVSPGPMTARLRCANRRGRIPTDPNLAVSGCSGVWALGDCAEVYPPHGDKPYPPTAQHALREGIHAANNIVAAIDGRPLRPFAYTTIGQMANLGERRGVAMVGGLKVSGFPAWWLWRTYYLGRLPTLERKLRVAIDWTIDLLFSRDTVKLEVPRS